MQTFYQDTFTSDGARRLIDLPSAADYFAVRNLTNEALVGDGTRGVKFEWFLNQTADGAQLRTFKTAAANTLEMTSDASGGFTYVTALPNVEAAVAGTIITQANPAVCTANAHGYSNGDRVRMTNNAVMKQLSGLEFTVSNVTANTFELAGLDTSNAAIFPAAETGFVVRRLSSIGRVEPKFLYVTAVSQANPAVVTVSTAHNYVVGQRVKFNIPSSFGMQELNQKKVTITAVGAYTLTLDLNSSAFSAFAFPLAALSPNAALFAVAASSGQRNSYNIDEVPYRSGQNVPYMQLEAGSASPAGATGDVMLWQAWKAFN